MSEAMTSADWREQRTRLEGQAEALTAELAELEGRRAELMLAGDADELARVRTRTSTAEATLRDTRHAIELAGRKAADAAVIEEAERRAASIAQCRTACEQRLALAVDIDFELLRLGGLVRQWIGTGRLIDVHLAGLGQDMPFASFTRPTNEALLQGAALALLPEEVASSLGLNMAVARTQGVRPTDPAGRVIARMDELARPRSAAA